MLNEQVRSDLERLQDIVQDRWRQGHCLLSCMGDFLPLTTESYMMYGQRRRAMASAMGFDHFSAMYVWNDQKNRNVEDVVLRIKEALDA